MSKNSVCSPDLSTIGGRLKQCRLDKHLLQYGAEEALGMAQSTLSKYEKGRCNVPPVHILEAGIIWKVNLNWLFWNKGPKAAPRYILDKPKSFFQKSEKGLSNRLFTWRQTKGLTQIQVEKRLKLGKKSLSHYETGARSMPYPLVIKLAELYEIDIYWLLYGIEE